LIARSTIASNPRTFPMSPLPKMAESGLKPKGTDATIP
jgi:hypothetical protein